MLLRISRSHYASGRCWRWHAATGAALGRAGRRVAPGQARGQLHHAPGMRGASPHGHAPRRYPAARQQLVNAQRLRPELTYAIPHLAVQARIELTHAPLALADLAGARTLSRGVDELLRRRPSLGTLVGEAEALRAQLSKLRGPDAPGASALTAAELRLLPILATHLSFPQIAEQIPCPATPSRRKRPRSTASSGPRRGIRQSCGRGISASSTGDPPAVGGLFRASSGIPRRTKKCRTRPQRADRSRLGPKWKPGHGVTAAPDSHSSARSPG